MKKRENPTINLHPERLHIYHPCSSLLSLVQLLLQLTMNINVDERGKDWLHQLVLQGRQLVVVELEPLQGVEVLEGAGRYVGDTEN